MLNSNDLSEMMSRTDGVEFQCVAVWVEKSFSLKGKKRDELIREKEREEEEEEEELACEITVAFANAFLLPISI